MGTETPYMNQHNYLMIYQRLVKLNNPQMGTETYNRYE